MDERERERFDELLEEVLGALPERLHRLLEEVPLIVDDRPSEELLRSLAQEWGEPEDDLETMALDLCGLHSGIALTERSVEVTPDVPDSIAIFREGIIAHAGGWDGPDAEEIIREEIRITVLHEIGHHFGLDEDDLADLGYD